MVDRRDGSLGQGLPRARRAAYILFGETNSEFAFGCVTGSFGGVGESDAIAFDWDGADEMDEACGDGWADLQDDGSLVGEITFRNGDES
jgi:hypothetical protein